MPKESYELGNLSFNDESRSSDYLITKDAYAKPFHIPIDMNEFYYAYAGQELGMICESTLAERRNYTYTKEQIDNKIEELVNDVNQSIAGAVNANGDYSTPIQDDKLVISILSTEE